MALLHKISVWTQVRKIKRNLSFNQLESCIKDLRLILKAIFIKDLFFTSMIIDTI